MTTLDNEKVRTFKVEVRADCKVCGKNILHNRFRTYCSEECRNKSNNQKRAEYIAKWQLARYDKLASIPDPERKCQCLICGKWYVQVGSHVFLRHNMTGRQYREKFELEVKRGIVPEWYRKLKGNQALDNQTYLNLEKGLKFRFKKGQKGIGKYKRSRTTLERLATLHKLRKAFE